MNQEYLGKIKEFYQANKNDLYAAGVVFLVGMIGFGLGRLSILMPKKHAIQIANPASISAGNNENPASTIRVSLPVTPGKIVASKNGSAYYFTWCSNAIKETNKMYFDTEESAQKAGYVLAKNCKK